MTEIFVDGDACPVKEEVERVAGRHQLTVYIISNGHIAHEGPAEEIKQQPAVLQRYLGV